MTGVEGVGTLPSMTSADPGGARRSAVRSAPRAAVAMLSILLYAAAFPATADPPDPDAQAPGGPAAAGGMRAPGGGEEEARDWIEFPGSGEEPVPRMRGDFRLHAMGGAAAALAAAAFAAPFLLPARGNSGPAAAGAGTAGAVAAGAVAFGAGAAIGLIKEAFDIFGMGAVEREDLAHTLAGSAAAALVAHALLRCFTAADMPVAAAVPLLLAGSAALAVPVYGVFVDYSLRRFRASRSAATPP